MMDQSQIMNHHQVFLTNKSHKMMKNQLQMLMNQPQMVNQSKMMMAQNYGLWPQPPPNTYPTDDMKFINQIQMYGGIAKPKRSNWRAKKSMEKRKDLRWKDKVSGVGGCHKKRLYKRKGPCAHAPRNTTSYIIRAKKSGGIASLVSPCPVTPAMLPTPVFSPSREALVEMAKEEWGVDGYGSMKGLIRVRSSGHDVIFDDYDWDKEARSSESEVEEHVEVERRLDHDLSRFEMIYPNSGVGVDYHNVLENRVDDQDTHIAQLEEENLIVKERLYLMEREVGELRRRLLRLERQNQVVEHIEEEEAVNNVSENDSEGVRSNPLLDRKRDDEVDSVRRNRAEESVSRRDESCDELSHKGPRELVMKEGSHSDAEENNQEDEHVQEPGIEQKEKQKSWDNEPVADVCMGGRAAEEVIECDRLNGVNEKQR